MKDLHGKLVAENEHVLKGRITIPGLINYGTVHTAEILYNTVEGWNSQTTLVSAPQTMYVYTDYEIDGDGNHIAGYKIGDGNAYLIDLPFYSTVTLEQKASWDNKVRCFINPLDPENLIFTED